MRTEDETRRLVRLRQQVARSELRLARLRKRGRAKDAHLKFRLGALAELLGWDRLRFDKIERLIDRVGGSIDGQEAVNRFQAIGTDWFQRHDGVDTPASLTDEPAGPDQVRARTHRLITIGGLFVREELDQVDRAALFGSMLELDRTTGPYRPPDEDEAPDVSERLACVAVGEDASG